MKWLGFLTALLLAAFAAVAIASNSGESTGSRSSAPSSAAQPVDCTPATAGDRAAQHPAAAYLAVLRRPRTTCDALPTGFGKQRYPDHEPPADLGSSRRVQTTPTEVNWVMPGAGDERQAVCIYGSGVMGCADADIIAEQGLTPGVAAWGNDIRLHGNVADGVTSVEVVLEGGERVTIPVRENTYTVRTDKWPREFRWRYRGQERVFDVPSRG